MAIRNIPEVAGYLAPTIGSTQVPSGATVSTVAGLTLQDVSFYKPSTSPLMVAGGYSSLANTVWTSTDAITWTTSTFAASTAAVNNVVVGLNGALIWTTAGNYYRSTDGITWSSLLNYGSSIAPNTVMYGNGLYVAASNSFNAISTSTDGITWTSRTLTNRSFSRSAYGNGIYVVMAPNTSNAARSTDGITWTESTLPSSSNWQYIAQGSGAFVALAGGTTTGARSTDGITWTTVTLPGTLANGIAYGNGVFVASELQNFVSRSTDGITWSRVSQSRPTSNRASGIEFLNNVFVLYIDNNSGQAYANYSTDGITWTSSSTVGSVRLQRADAGVIISNVSGSFNIVGSNGTLGQVIQSTGTGMQWATPSVPLATRTTLGGFYGFPGGLTYSADNSNVAIGGKTFGSDSGGNTAVSSYQNTLMGYGAMGGMNTGSFNNTAIGYNSGANLGAQGQSEDNTFIGMQCGYGFYQAASRNTSVGSTSMTTLTTTSDNTGIGYANLMSNTGSQNIAIGSQAAWNKTTGDNTITIGYNAQPSTNTTSNQITLGNSLISSLRCQVTSISGLSDERDKKDIVDLPVGLSFINGLRPVNFVWNMRPDLNEEGNVVATGKVDLPDMGFIAQDFIAAEDATGLAEHLQLTIRDNPEKLEATYGRLVPILVKAIQELTAKVEALEAK